MGKMHNRLSCLLFLFSAGGAACEETQACQGSSCLVESTEHAALQMLQVKSSAVRQPEACSAPQYAAFESKGKRCPPKEGDNPRPCLNDNRPYYSMEAAWEACATIEDCDVVTQYIDSKWYLRRANDPDIEGQGLKMYTYTCVPQWLNKAFIKTENAVCGWSLDDGWCQDTNYAFINAGHRNATNVDRAQALEVCGRMCKMNSTDCGGFLWNATARACYFRKNARCGLNVTGEAHDCYARRTEADLAMEHVLQERGIEPHLP